MYKTQPQSTWLHQGLLLLAEWSLYCFPLGFFRKLHSAEGQLSWEIYSPVWKLVLGVAWASHSLWPLIVQLANQLVHKVLSGQWSKERADIRNCSLMLSIHSAQEQELRHSWVTIPTGGYNFPWPQVCRRLCAQVGDSGGVEDWNFELKHCFSIMKMGGLLLCFMRGVWDFSVFPSCHHSHILKLPEYAQAARHCLFSPFPIFLALWCFNTFSEFPSYN